MLLHLQASTCLMHTSIQGNKEKAPAKVKKVVDDANYEKKKVKLKLT